MILTYPFFWAFIWIVVFTYGLLQKALHRTLILLVCTLFIYFSEFLWVDFLVLFLTTLFSFFSLKHLRNRGPGKWLIPILIALPFLFFKLQGLITHQDIAIPLGLSYVTFTLLAYAIDTIKNRSHPSTNLGTFLSSALFFSALPSGPIHSLPQTERQIAEAKPWNQRNLLLGVILIANGLFKKNIGDLISLVALQSKADILEMSVLDRWVSFLSLGAEFYADFSGYTDMALGFALLFGVHLPENFALPFLTTNMADFWSRWHMSLTGWARTYLFFPTMAKSLDLFGRENVRFVTFIATFATMLFIGLWHDISISFFVWAGYNTLLILFTPWLDAFLSRLTRYSKGILLPLNYLLIVTGFLFFRLPNSEAVMTFLSSLFQSSTKASLTPLALIHSVYTLLALSIPHALDAMIRKKEDFFLRKTVWFLFILVVAIFCIGAGRATQPFIYMRY